MKIEIPEPNSFLGFLAVIIVFAIMIFWLIFNTQRIDELENRNISKVSEHDKKMMNVVPFNQRGIR